MKVVIIEDEFPAAERLIQLLTRSNHDIEILDTLQSVQQGIKWFQAHPAPDLVFSDIQLSDGLSFEIYDAIQLRCPIIFTTAYDEYAIKAFKLNSIDYLVKPIQPADLKGALDQYLEHKNGSTQPANLETLQTLLNELHISSKTYKERFLVKSSEALLPVFVQEIAYFLSAHEITSLVRKDGKRFPLDYTLTELETLLDPAFFYRLNRQCIVHASAIQKVYPYFNGRLVADLLPKTREEVIISKSRAAAFKKWLEEGTR